MDQRPADIVINGFRNRGVAPEDLGIKILYAAEGIVEGVQYAHAQTLSRLKRLLPVTIRNTPHSCQTEEHCCALHSAHRAAADKVEKAIQDEIDKLEGVYIEPDPGVTINDSF